MCGILRRRRSRPPAFLSDNALVRFLSPPLHAGRAILCPCRLFFAPASCGGPVSVTGASFEEPAATGMVAAGSVVLCGSVLPDADACGVAFRVAMDAHFASHSDWLPCTTSTPPEGLASPPPTTVSGGLTWGLCWGPSGAGRRRWGWRGGGSWVRPWRLPAISDYPVQPQTPRPCSWPLKPIAAGAGLRTHDRERDQASLARSLLRSRG